MRARVTVMLRQGIHDPQGQTITRSLHTLGYETVTDVKQGKHFIITLATEDEERARREVDEMCARLLSNPVIEGYSFTLEPREGGS